MLSEWPCDLASRRVHSHRVLLICILRDYLANSVPLTVLMFSPCSRTSQTSQKALRPATNENLHSGARIFVFTDDTVLWKLIAMQDFLVKIHCNYLTATIYGNCKTIEKFARCQRGPHIVLSSNCTTVGCE